MLGFGVAAAIFVAVVIAFSNSVRPSDLQELLEKLPEALRTLIGLREGELFDVSRWAGVIHDHPVWLTLILSYPLVAGLRGVAGGVDDGTLEVVLAQPLSRRAYYSSLVAVVALGVTVVLGLSLAGGLIARALIDLPGDLPLSTLIVLSTSGWALAMAVAGIALLSSVVGAGGGRPVLMAVGTVLVMYFLRFLATMIPAVSWIDSVSVFGYHDTRELVAQGLSAAHLLALLVVWLGAVVAGFLIFRRKQLTF
jgi:ABC-2 type transport system permease protein